MLTNAAKTKCLFVTGKRPTNKIVDGSLNLHLGNSISVDGKRLLVLTIDLHRSFNIHVEELCKKLSQIIAVSAKEDKKIPPH